MWSREKISHSMYCLLGTRGTSVVVQHDGHDTTHDNLQISHVNNTGLTCSTHDITLSFGERHKY